MGVMSRICASASLAGEDLDNGDWHMMMDYAERFKDPTRHLFRASPGSFTARGAWRMNDSDLEKQAARFAAVMLEDELVALRPDS